MTRNLWWKRPVDLALVVVLAPIAIVAAGAVAALVAGTLGSPVLFRQRRIGRGGRSFTLYKFRTMAGGDGGADGERLTAVGRWLRATSLDELPQLWNVLIGEMSLVGPRPLLPDYLPLYSPEQARRHEVRPGLTGWAQVNGRNAQSWEERFRFDGWYVDRASFLLDLKIMLLTVGQVVARRGISQPGRATMERFRGHG